jgi:hypothetical protein
MNVALAATLARGGFAANPLRLALAVACIALGVALAAAVHTVHTSALAEVETAARALAGSADLEIRGPRSGFDDALFASIALRPEVLAASPVVEVDASLAGREETLRVLGIDPFRALRLQPAFVAGGGANVADSAALLDARSAWLSPPAAARLGLRKGSTFRTQVASGTSTGRWRACSTASPTPASWRSSTSPRRNSASPASAGSRASTCDCAPVSSHAPPPRRSHPSFPRASWSRRPPPSAFAPRRSRARTA